MELLPRHIAVLRAVRSLDDVGFPEFTRTDDVHALQSAGLIGPWSDGKTLRTCRITAQGQAVLDEIDMRAI